MTTQLALSAWCSSITGQQARQHARMHEDRWYRTHRSPFLGKLLQLLHINLLGLGYGIVLRGVDGRLQLERVLAIYLLPVDGAIRAVDGLMPKLHRDTICSQMSCCTSLQGHLQVLQQFRDMMLYPTRSAPVHGQNIPGHKCCSHWDAKMDLCAACDAAPSSALRAQMYTIKYAKLLLWFCALLSRVLQALSAKQLSAFPMLFS